MKYKVWGKAKAVLKPQKHHFETIVVIAFVAALLAAIVIAVRLGMMYADTFYSGETEPYLQSLTSTQVTIRWQSKSAVKASVEYATDPNQAFSRSPYSGKQQRHEVTLSELKPATRYYYRLLHDDTVFRGGNDYWFETAPLTGSNDPVRIWLLGDPGMAGEEIRAVQSSIKQWLNANSANRQSQLNMIISTGDSAYEKGSNEEYQRNLFAVHQSFFKNYVFWPVYGNHDAKGWSFFNLFTLPKQAEAGGVPSGTEQYYSVDYGALHLIFLDSNSGAYQMDDEMLEWLKKDLAATKQKWLIAFMHHPPYTRGSHNSNDPRDSGNRMFNMRKRVIPILEQAGVDMVISGHSHSYERSYLIDCHYGLSSDFENLSALQRGPYFKKPIKRLAHAGTIYTVVGSSSIVRKGKLDHPAMAISTAEAGSMIIDIDNHVLTSYFINNRSEVVDKFSLEKSNSDVAILRSSCQ